MRMMDMGPYPVVAVGLITSAKDWYRQASWFGFTEPWPLDEAKTQWFDVPLRHSPLPLVIVTMREVRRMDRHVAIGYCVHEAVHVWQYICEYIRAGRTGREIEAYSVQWISGWLIKELKL